MSLVQLFVGLWSAVVLSAIAVLFARYFWLDWRTRSDWPEYVLLIVLDVSIIFALGFLGWLIAFASLSNAADAGLLP
jgi:hypothetical protein